MALIKVQMDRGTKGVLTIYVEADTVEQGISRAKLHPTFTGGGDAKKIYAEFADGLFLPETVSSGIEDQIKKAKINK